MRALREEKRTAEQQRGGETYYHFSAFYFSLFSSFRTHHMKINKSERASTAANYNTSKQAGKTDDTTNNENNEHVNVI